MGQYETVCAAEAAPGPEDTTQPDRTSSETTTPISSRAEAPAPPPPCCALVSSCWGHGIAGTYCNGDSWVCAVFNVVPRCPEEASPSPSSLPSPPLSAPRVTGVVSHVRGPRSHCLCATLMFCRLHPAAEAPGGPKCQQGLCIGVIRTQDGGARELLEVWAFRGKVPEGRKGGDEVGTVVLDSEGNGWQLEYSLLLGSEGRAFGLYWFDSGGDGGILSAFWTSKTRKVVAKIEVRTHPGSAPEYSGEVKECCVEIEPCVTVAVSVTGGKDRSTGKPLAVCLLFFQGYQSPILARYDPVALEFLPEPLLKLPKYSHGTLDGSSMIFYSHQPLGDLMTVDCCAPTGGLQLSDTKPNKTNTWHSSKARDFTCPKFSCWSGYFALGSCRQVFVWQVTDWRLCARWEAPSDTWGLITAVHVLPNTTRILLCFHHAFTARAHTFHLLDWSNFGVVQLDL